MKSTTIDAQEYLQIRRGVQTVFRIAVKLLGSPKDWVFTNTPSSKHKGYDIVNSLYKKGKHSYRWVELPKKAYLKYDPASGWHFKVKITDDAELYAVLCHFEITESFLLGKESQLIKVGATGRASGPHIHLQFKVTPGWSDSVETKSWKARMIKQAENEFERQFKQTNSRTYSYNVLELPSEENDEKEMMYGSGREFGSKFREI